MDLTNITKLAQNIRETTLESVTDDDILQEVDKRGLHMGVMHRDLANLVKYTSEQDWDKVHRLVKRLAQDNLGIII